MSVTGQNLQTFGHPHDDNDDAVSACVMVVRLLVLGCGIAHVKCE
jgi:hypothetical protein